jgi:vacuolar protein sorting-associated protein 13A/C
MKSSSLLSESLEGTLPLLKSGTSIDESPALLKMHYARIQPESPEFVDKYGGFDQAIRVQLSTFVFSAAPGPVLALYDFMMATFVSGKHNSSPHTPVSDTAVNGSMAEFSTDLATAETSSRISLDLGLSGVQRGFLALSPGLHALTIT